VKPHTDPNFSLSFMKAYLPDQTRISQVHLRTANLQTALKFYTEVLGLKARQTPGSGAILSAGTRSPELIVLSQDVDAPQPPPRSTGLYHLALRYPGRQALGQAYQRLARKGYPVTGASDHGVSEAIYLSDPDGNGIELYADRPRAEWVWRNGQIAMPTKALDLDGLLAAAGKFTTPAPPLPSDIGHIHLSVADLAAAERFYGEYLGFSVTQRSYPGALFFAAGGYHHHIGVNTWAGTAAPPAGSVGLVSYRLEVPCAEILYCLGHRAPLMGYGTRTEPARQGPPFLQIRDPNATWLEVQPSTTASGSEPGSPCCTDPEAAQIAAASQGTRVPHGQRPGFMAPKTI
jgi:catechol 2,3-dioxygenase